MNSHYTINIENRGLKMRNAAKHTKKNPKSEGLNFPCEKSRKK